MKLLLAFSFFTAFSANAQWEELNSGTTQDLNEIFFPTTDTGFVIGYSGTVLKTTDGGDNWMSLSTGVTTDFYDIYFLNSQEGWIVGDSGRVCHTINSGSNWNCTSLPNSDDFALHSVFALDSDRLFVGGQTFSDTSTISITMDGGLNWLPTYQETGIWDVDIKKLRMVNSSVGYAINRGYILKTTDSGWHWSITDTASVNDGAMFVLMEDIATFPNNDTVYACGWYGGYFGTTVNAAQTWQHNFNYQNYNLDFLNTQVGYIGGWGHVHKTTDGGQTFQDASGGSELLFTDIYSIDFTDEMTGYACGYGGRIIRTENGGGLSVNELADNQWLVYPNPTNDKIQVQLSSNLIGTTYQLINLTGQVVCSGEFTQLNNSITAEHLEAGVYQLFLSNSSVSKKIIVK